VNSLTEERLRIARELHDGVAQEVAALGYRLDELIGRSETTSDIRKSLRDIRMTVTNLGSSIRDEIFLLRNLESRRLEELLTQIAYETFHGTNIKFEIISKFELPGSAISEVGKIVQEAFINIKNHSNASRVAVNIDEVGLIISDDGNMLEKEDKNSWGIVGMKERAKKLGFGFNLVNRNPGTTVELKW
jgi:NarL family two-component system sensor histidine kinase LiaS